MNWRILLFVFAVFLSQNVKAQVPVANFTSNKTSGCGPLVVSFRDSSSGNPKFWNWDFGNGTLSNVQNPTVSYGLPGTYTVTLVVRNNDGTNGITKTDYITVQPSPQVSFRASQTQGCLPSTISFTDLSTSPSGTITSWLWNFGDGDSSTERNPTHQYTRSGFFNVSLRVTSSSGCSNSSTRVRYIRIVSGVEAEFLNAPSVNCKPPFPVRFSNQSSGPGNLTYTWSFGNSQTSTQDNPTASYNAPGDYTVRLIAASEYGCSDTTEKQISITGITTDFTAQDTACVNSRITFTNNSAQQPVSTNWYLNNNLVATDPNMALRFDIPGTYSVKMVNDYGDCMDSVTKNILISTKPTLNYTASSTTFCQAPANVTFTDQTPNAISWNWDFGDGSTGSGQSVQHSYQSNGSFPLTLVVSDRFGCTDTLKTDTAIRILPPTVQVTNVTAGGCVPFSFTPQTNIQTVDGVASYFWDFGNGTTSTAAQPTAVYNQLGLFDLTLRITTNGGCTATVTYNDGVTTGAPPVPDYSISRVTACSDNPVTFTDLSNPVTEWLWDFGDGGTSTDRNPVHNYHSSGTFNVSLTASNLGCARTIVKPALITIAPPSAGFSYQPDCSDPRRVAFTDTSSIDPSKTPLTYSWNFGDGNSSTDKNPTHVYQALGTYTVQLTVTNDTCSSVIITEIKLVNEPADFQVSNQPMCGNSAVTLEAINSNPDNIQWYEWTIGNNAPYVGGRTLSRTMSGNGNFDVKLRIADLNGCITTKTMPGLIRVAGPTAGFTPNRQNACKNAPVSFTSTSSSTQPITSYRFNFGDNSEQDFTAPPFTHVYQDTGWFKVSLTVTDASGCSRTFERDSAVYVSAVRASFGSDTTTFCPGMPVQFSDSSTGRNLTYRWDFGDGSFSNQQEPIHSYGAFDSTYTVSLRVQNNLGCADSMTRTNYISIRRPKAAFDVSDTLTICPPFETRFTLRASDYQSYYWDFGDSSDYSLLQDPRHFYNTYDTFTAKLYVVGFGGCLDSASRPIYVVNPNSSAISYSPLNACNRLAVDFNIRPPSSTTFYFSFGDGRTDSSQTTSFSHLYNTPAFYNPSLLIKDNVGCEARVSGGQTIRIIGALPFFGVDKTEFCDTGQVFFTNFTIGNDPITGFLWNFGDGNTSTNRDEVHAYNSPGSYIASLTVNTRSGCTETFYDTISVYRTPVASIQSPDTVCVNNTVLFQGQLAVADTGTVTYNWDFGDGQSSTMKDVSMRYTRTGDFNVRLDTRIPFGCSSTVSKNVHVTTNPTIQLLSEPVATVGSGVTIPVTYTGPITTYTWSPPESLSCANCPTPFATPRSTTQYRVTVVDRYGCSTFKDITVKVVCSNQNLFIPNTFSPNNDGANDMFYPRGSGILRVKSMRVFNRWGEIVFEKINFNANQMSAGWDGTYKGRKADTDVYIYNIEVVCENGEIYNYKGNVMLLK